MFSPEIQGDAVKDIFELILNTDSTRLADFFFCIVSYNICSFLFILTALISAAGLYFSTILLMLFLLLLPHAQIHPVQTLKQIFLKTQLLALIK